MYRQFGGIELLRSSITVREHKWRYLKPSHRCPLAFAHYQMLSTLIKDVQKEKLVAFKKKHCSNWYELWDIVLKILATYEDEHNLNEV